MNILYVGKYVTKWRKTYIKPFFIIGITTKVFLVVTKNGKPEAELKP